MRLTPLLCALSTSAVGDKNPSLQVECEWNSNTTRPAAPVGFPSSPSPSWSLTEASGKAHRRTNPEARISSAVAFFLLPRPFRFLLRLFFSSPLPASASAASAAAAASWRTIVREGNGKKRRGFGAGVAVHFMTETISI